RSYKIPASPACRRHVGRSAAGPAGRRRAGQARAERPCPDGRLAVMADQKIVEIYTDGACSGNPGPGGWGAILHWNGHEKELWGGDAGPTTNNRMELMAAIQALESLSRPVLVKLHTDSS